MVGRGTRRSDPLSVVERESVLARLRVGEHSEEVAAALSCSLRTVQRVYAQSLVKSRRIGQSQLRLSFEEREQISRGVAAGESAHAIARQLGRPASTITRELNANGGRVRYRALRAHRRAIACAARPKRGKLAGPSRLRSEVEAGLVARWSPQQISARLRTDHPADLEMRISHETIYQSLYVQSRGALRRELTKCLRTGRAIRRPKRRADQRRGRIPDMIMISDRPAEVTDRAVPGHWEGDLIIGKDSASAIGTLVERATRYLLLLHLPHDHGAEAVRDAMLTAIATLPDKLRGSLTWDQGSEMARHTEITTATGMTIYFCDPHSPWQRPTNENTNGLLRQYFPKGTDLSVHSPDRLAAVAAELNGRPRMTLGWRTPAEALNDLLSTPAA
jgi:IS30 family transposase